MPINEKYLAQFGVGEYYHIYNRCPSERKLFLYPDNYFYFLDAIKKHVQGLDFLSYCLIPNHFHLFGQVKDIFVPSDNVNKIITEQFRRTFITYANAFNKKYNTHGTLFTSPFRRILVDSKEYFKDVIRYIHQNPVHHGLHKDFQTYRFSSYSSFLSDKPTLLRRDIVFDQFGGKENFIKYHELEQKSYVEFPFYYEDVIDFKSGKGFQPLKG